MSDNPAIIVEGVSKTFKLPHEKHNSVKSALINFGNRGFEKQQALNSVSFEVKKGEFFGIVGRNGSGKSTLLKLLSGIYTPDGGNITINGKLTPFIELGVGFNPELSGRENVFLNGALLGFNRREMEAMYEEIVEFAELERFMDQKLKNYSSGMQVRLAFSIAIRANTDILVLDEVLAVGDANFQRKCLDYFEQIKNTKKTVILVTHDMAIAKRFCDRGVLIEDGNLLADDDIDTIASMYGKINRSASSKNIEAVNKRKLDDQAKDAANQVYVANIWTENDKGEKTGSFQAAEKVHIKCEISVREKLDGLSVVLRCHNPEGPAIVATNSRWKHGTINLDEGKTVQLNWELPGIYNDGVYATDVVVMNEAKDKKYIESNDVFRFEIRGWESPYSITHPKDTLTLKRL